MTLQPPPPPNGGLLLPWLLTGGHVCRRYLVNRDLSEQPGLYQSGSPLGGGDGKLSHSKVSAPPRVSRCLLSAMSVHNSARLPRQARQ